ncbi:MAG: MerR family transcriptional regulator, partial [Actinomycetota bacterium]
MALETGRPYFSIGEVLNVLKDSFPDVTVSKIRFLESEGLIEPERTASGYRKFTEDDIERLRFILRLQRDHFLPLKVIRERLDELDSGEAAGTGQPTLLDAPQAAPGAEGDAPGAVEFLGGATGVSLSTSELAHASGLTPEQVEELTSFRFLHPTKLRESKDGEETEAVHRYDEHDLEAAKLCRALLELGLEPRHLKVFRNAADRWADLAEQVARPLERQRHPEARKAAQERVREVIRVGGKLVRVLLREAVGP